MWTKWSVVLDGGGKISARAALGPHITDIFVYKWWTKCLLLISSRPCISSISNILFHNLLSLRLHSTPFLYRAILVYVLHSTRHRHRQTKSTLNHPKANSLVWPEPYTYMYVYNFVDFNMLCYVCTELHKRCQLWTSVAIVKLHKPYPDYYCYYYFLNNHNTNNNRFRCLKG